MKGSGQGSGDGRRDGLWVQSCNPDTTGGRGGEREDDYMYIIVCSMYHTASCNGYMGNG